MAARGYEFYLRVLKVSLTSERSKQTSERQFQHEKIKFLSPSGHVMFYYYIDIDEMFKLATCFTSFRNDEKWSPTANNTHVV